MAHIYPVRIQAGFDWNEWIGLPYATGGRGPTVYDCWGLTRSVIVAGTGILLPEFSQGYENTDLEGDVPSFIQAQRECEHWQRIPIAEAQPFDAMLFRVGGRVNHIGPVIKKGLFLHISKASGSFPESYTGVKWHQRIVECYRATNVYTP